MAARFHDVAQQIQARIARGDYPVGSALPSASQLAREFGVARGTIQRGLEELESELRLITHRGNRWLVHEATHPQSVTVLRSFGQWALAVGLRPEGLVLTKSYGRASQVEARQLAIRPMDRVLRVVRVRSLNGRRVMVERTTYAGWLADAVDALPPDAPSIMTAVSHEHGIEYGHAEQQIFAIAADAQDSRILGVAGGTPLLRVMRTAYSDRGRGLEYSDDRYLSSAVSFTLSSSSPAAAGPVL